MSEPLVDLLLVRLGGDEEKKKVTRLLVTELDMTVGEAEKAVDNSPVVIRESVAIGEARIIQKNLYPYIDLLPRLEEDQAATLKEKVQFVSPPDDTDDFNVEDEEIPSSAAAGAEEDDEEGEDDFLLTTASDEMLQIERCHICGKTPVGGERLAPCRTCGDLTCRECFDRAAHVCHKCAAEGHSVDRPVASKSPAKHHGTRSTAAPAPSGESPDRGQRSKKALLAAVIVVVLVLFYFLDPMGVFTPEHDSPHVTVADPDTTITNIPPDTLESPPDTVAVTAPVQDPIGVLALSLPDSLLQDRQSPPIEPFTRIPGSISASSATEELAAIIPQLESLAAMSGLTIDRAALLVYGDRTKSDHLSVLVVAVNHPENNETRFSFLSAAAEWLIPGGVDQLVLFYRETRFHQPQVFSYTRQVFPQLSLAFSPSEFMDLATTHDALWASLTGPVMEWICTN